MQYLCIRHIKVIKLNFSGKSVDYNTHTQTIYWTELENEDDLNATLYTSNIGGGDKTDFFDEFDTGMVGSPYAIAFDWIGQNLYLANREASTIELIKMDGKRKFKAHDAKIPSIRGKCEEIRVKS